MTSLRKASYNGISFEVTAGSVSFGRRIVTHEYPQRDLPYSEDMGRSAKSFTVEGFIVGDDYLDRAEKLIRVFEQNHQDNPGRLVHPWLGTVMVYPSSNPVVNWNLQRRFAQITLNFVEAGELSLPAQATDYAQALRELTDSLVTNTLTAFKSTLSTVKKYSTFTRDLAYGTYLNLSTALSSSNLSKAFNLSSQIENIFSTSSGITTYDELGENLSTTLCVSPQCQSSRDYRQLTSALIQDVKSSIYSKATDNLASTIAESGTSITGYNTIVSNLSDSTKCELGVESLIRRTMLSNALGTASRIGTSLDLIEDAEVTYSLRSDSQIGSIRDDLLDRLEYEMLALGRDDEDLYQNFADLYAMVWRSMDKMQSTTSTIEYSPKEATNAFALAYDRYTDSSRADEISTRNDVINPLFLGVDPLKILNE